MAKNVFIGGLCLGSVALGFGLGYSVNDGGVEKSLASIEQKQSVAVGGSSTEESQSKPVKKLVTKVKSNRALTASEAMVTSLSLLNRQTNFMDFAKMTQVYLNFKNLSEDELKEAFTYLPEINNRRTSAAFKLMLYSLWAEKNPMAALEHNKGNNAWSKSWTENTIIGVWAEKDPNAAYAWYQSVANVDPLKRSRFTNFLEPMFTSFAKEDLDGALGKLNDLSDRDQENSYKGIVKGVDDTSTFISLINSFEEEQKTSFVQTTINEWTKKDPYGVIEWSKNLEDEKLAKDYEKKARESWIKQNPKEAAEWILNQTEEGQERQAIDEITQSWNWRDGQGLSDWLETQESNNLSDKTYSSVAQRLSRVDLYEATDWASQINDSEEKVKSLKGIYRRASRRDEAAATDLINSVDTLTEDEVSQILKK